MRCERCNHSKRAALACVVNKAGTEVERRLCGPCRDETRKTYPVTVVEEAATADETPQDGPQAASAPAPAPKGRQPAKVHMRAYGGGPLCRQANVKDVNLAYHRSDVTCGRCLAKL